MRYPGFLQDNGTIGFVAPSFGCATEPYLPSFLNAQKKLGDMGFKADLGPNCYKSEGIGISNTPEKCGEELTDYYISNSNDILISCGGGECMCETLDYVDFDSIAKANPKWYMGYSDNTNFTFLLETLCDTASVYGPCAAEFGMEPWHESIEDALMVLQGKKQTVSGYGKWQRDELKDRDNPTGTYILTEETKIVCVPDKNLTFNGRLIGGCLDVLVNLVGTKYDKTSAFLEKYKEDGFIWFLEACDLNVFGIRRSLWAMDSAGWFKYCKGFIIGRPLHFGEEMMGLDQYTAVTGILGKYGVPIVMDIDIGHLDPHLPIICGSMATVTTKNNDYTIEMRLE